LGGEYTEKCDEWSCGVVLYILLSGLFPFYGHNYAEIVEAITKRSLSFGENTLHLSYIEFEVWETISDDAKDLVSKLLIQNPRKRMTALEALGHDFILHNAPKNRFAKRHTLKPKKFASQQMLMLSGTKGGLLRNLSPHPTLLLKHGQTGGRMASPHPSTVQKHRDSILKNFPPSADKIDLLSPTRPRKSNFSRKPRKSATTFIKHDY
jgi:serine/threonine protein kinase